MPYTPENLEPWTRPDSYFGSTWEGWFAFLGSNRDADALTRANFDAGWKRLSALPDVEVLEDGKAISSVRIVEENHWAVGWVKWIAIHGSNTAALEAADKMVEKLEGYPVLDEELFSEYEQDAACRDIATV